METIDFLESLFGTCEGSGWFFAVWTLDGRTRTFPVWRKGYEEAAAYAAERSAEVDAYVAVCPLRREPGTGRGKLEDVAALNALWVDIDVDGPWRKAGKPMPGTFADAMGIVNAVGIQPSMVVDSGHGVHAYWILSEPVEIDSDEGRVALSKTSRRWWQTVDAVAKVRGGWSIDPCHDLTRVLRIPGTVNRKADPNVPVKTILPIRSVANVRHHLQDLEALLVEEVEPFGPSGTSRPVEVGFVDLRIPDQPPEIVRMVVEIDPRNRRTWERKRGDLRDQSASSYDMAVADMLVSAGASDQEVADAIAFWRSRHGQRPEKALRRDYVQRTIRRARETRRDEVENVRALDDVGDMVQSNALPVNAGAIMAGIDDPPLERTESPQDGPEGLGLSEDERMHASVEAVSVAVREALDKVGLALGLDIEKVERIGDDRVSYTLHVRGRSPAVIGGVPVVMSPTDFRRRVIETLNIVPKAIKPQKWEAIASAIFRVAVPIAVPESGTDWEVREWLSEYFRDGAPVHRGEEWRDGLEVGEPFVADGRAGIHARSFVRYVKMRQGEKIEPRVLYSCLRIIGFEQQSIAIRTAEGGSSSRSYWVGPAARVEGSAPPREAPASERNGSF